MRPRSALFFWRTLVLAPFAALPGNLRGTLWILGAGLFFTVMMALIKEAGEQISVFQILFLRQLTMTLAVSPVLVKNAPEIFYTRHLRLHAARVILALVAMTAGFTAVIYLPLADVTALTFAKSIFVTIFAVWFLAETADRARWLAVLVGFVGVLVMVKPSAAGLNIFALLAVLSAASAAGVMVLIRRIAQTDRPTTILAYQAIFVGVVAAFPAFYFWTSPSPLEWAMMIAVGLLSVAGQYCNIQAFKAGEASAIAPMDYSRLIYATLIGWWIFAELPNPTTVAGAALIVVASVITMRSARQSETR
ncbi:MAG: DMT family transporter [Pseudomonadota bacterium]|nr:DMT family transporter [Pseudomonadota bacterium]